MSKEDFSEELKKIGLSKKEFAEICGISYMTVNNWNDENRPVPNWVFSWLTNYIKSKDLDKITKLIKPYIKDEKDE